MSLKTGYIEWYPDATGNNARNGVWYWVLKTSGNCIPTSENTGCRLTRPSVSLHCDIQIEAPAREWGTFTWYQGLINICGCRCATDSSGCGTNNTKEGSGTPIRTYSQLPFDVNTQYKMGRPIASVKKVKTAFRDKFRYGEYTQ